MKWMDSYLKTSIVLHLTGDLDDTKFSSSTLTNEQLDYIRARDFYAVIVDEGEARINYHRIGIERESRESEVKHGIFNKKFDF